VVCWTEGGGGVACMSDTIRQVYQVFLKVQIVFGDEDILIERDGVSGVWARCLGIRWREEKMHSSSIAMILPRMCNHRYSPYHSWLQTYLTLDTDNVICKSEEAPYAVWFV
jgi:hypothetical protein